MTEFIQGDIHEIFDILQYEGLQFDLIIADPPYGSTPLKWDKTVSFTFLWEYFNKFTKPTSPVLIFGQEPFSSHVRLSNEKDYKYDWYWQKERLTNVFQVKRRPGKVIECVSVFYKEQPYYNPQKRKHTGKKVTNKVGSTAKFSDTMSTSSIKPLEYEDDGTRHPLQIVKYKRDKKKIHPTQKPYDLMKMFVETYTVEDDWVLDPFCGSRVLEDVCRDLNRNYIGVDITDYRMGEIE